MGGKVFSLWEQLPLDVFLSLLPKLPLQDILCLQQVGRFIRLSWFCSSCKYNEGSHAGDDYRKVLSRIDARFRAPSMPRFVSLGLLWHISTVDLVP